MADGKMVWSLLNLGKAKKLFGGLTMKFFGKMAFVLVVCALLIAALEAHASEYKTFGTPFLVEKKGHDSCPTPCPDPPPAPSPDDPDDGGGCGGNGGGGNDGGHDSTPF